MSINSYSAEFGTMKLAASAAIVDLPDPDDPTKAVTDPGFTSNEILWRTVFSSLYPKVTLLNE